jgi:cysteine synthase A
VIPETQSQEKKDMLTLCGAELVQVPAVPYSNPNNYQHVGRRLAEELKKTEPNGVHLRRPVEQPRQPARALHLDRPGDLAADRRQGRCLRLDRRHRRTLAGASTFLREMKKDIVIGCADPRGAAMYNLFAHGEAKPSEGGSITEGIGLGRVTPIIEDIKCEKAYLIPDEEAIPYIFDLLEHEGLCLGGSSAINIAGAVRLAKDLGPGKVIVTLLCDSGTRYQSKLYNPDFLRSKGLPVPSWLERKSKIKPPFV